MEFQLLKLIIWPRSEEFPPREVVFEPGKVNVITGVSRTGKSAIIPIIDYCLASSDCFIPIDTIRDHASWYGVVFQTESEQILISRKVPVGNKVSNEYYLLRGDIVSIPNTIKEANEKPQGIKHILNTLSSVPYFSLEGDDNNVGAKARLGFRDLMALVFQTQDIVANQNILFYKTHAHEHREKLRNWFPFILGAEDLEILEARQRLQEIDKTLKQLKREFDRAKAVSSAWMSNMLGHLNVAKEYGLIDKIISEETKPEELIDDAKYILEQMPQHTQTKFTDIDNANQELVEHEKKEEELSIKIGIAKKRLNDVKRLKSGLEIYGKSVKKRVERLHISRWLEDIAGESQVCPACGSTDHPNGKAELSKISSAFEKYEQESKRVEKIPTSFSREELHLNAELEQLLEEKKEYQNRFDYLMARDKKAQKEFQRRKNMFVFLGELKSSMKTFESLSDGGEFKTKIEELERERKTLAKLADRGGVKNRVENATKIISQGVLNHLKTLDVEDKYRKIAPEFNVNDLNISVLSNDDSWHFLAEVGSASNWVSFHIALFCSLQEYFLEQETSCVPNFVIFDQPSQVYFPKLKRGESLNEDDPLYEDEDVMAVKSIFETIAKSIIGKKGAWQSIILDHADADIYGAIEGVHEVEIWRQGKKLIPQEW